MKTVKEKINYLTDVFTGEDGGVTFVKLTILLDQIEKQDDYPSKKILNIVDQFVKLVKYAERKI